MSGKRLLDNVGIFKCPVCGGGMAGKGEGSIACDRGHNFDLAKSGYVNLLLSPPKSGYDRDLWRSRNQIFKLGFFSPLIEHIKRIIIRLTDKGDAGCGIRILDAGCGEGSQLAGVIRSLSSASFAGIEGFGIDISKSGIQIASKRYPDFVWCVADLARIPFVDRQFDVVLNILSPSNYEEFNRVMTEKAILIKVIPGEGYLSELRRCFFDESHRRDYSNRRVINHFERKFKVLDMEELKYEVAIDKEGLGYLVRMTPMSWNVPEERLSRVSGMDIGSVTVDYTIITGAGGSRKNS